MIHMAGVCKTFENAINGIWSISVTDCSCEDRLPFQRFNSTLNVTLRNLKICFTDLSLTLFFLKIIAISVHQVSKNTTPGRMMV